MKFLARTALLAALPLTTLLASCGGGSDKKVPADDWVADLCDAAVSFQKASDKAGEGFLEVDFGDTKKAKAAFKDSVEKQQEAQKDFRADFDKIGQPDIQDGDKVVDAFKDQFEENDKATDDVAKAVAKIDNDDDFMEEFLKVADDFDTPDFRAKLEDLADDSDDVADLIDSIDEDSECSSVIFDQAGSDDTSSANPTATPKASKTATTSKTAVPTAAAAKTTNEKWVAGVCTSLGGWIQDLENANTKLDSTLNTAKDAPALKQALVDFMKTGQTETKNLQKEIAALKAPDVKDGAAIQKTFNDAMTQLVSVFDGLVSDAQKVGTGSLTQTTTDVERIAGGITDAFDDVATTFDKLDNYNAGELDTLFDQRPECQGIK
ncbi:MAG: hypothetical protein U0837_06260 [Dehalococcoidia bacterium]